MIWLTRFKGSAGSRFEKSSSSQHSMPDIDGFPVISIRKDFNRGGRVSNRLWFMAPQSLTQRGFAVIEPKSSAPPVRIVLGGSSLDWVDHQVTGPEHRRVRAIHAASKYTLNQLLIKEKFCFTWFLHHANQLLDDKVCTESIGHLQIDQLSIRVPSAHSHLTSVTAHFVMSFDTVSVAPKSMGSLTDTPYRVDILENAICPALLCLPLFMQSPS